MQKRILEGLQPERVFYYFEEISRIPRPSFHEKAISDYLVAFAKEHKLEYYQDELYNVIMIRPASEGYESEEPIIIQGHMDMVCEKTADTKKKMHREPLDLFVDGDLIGAKGTTLGGDDGIAIAFALTLLEDDSFKAPRLEFVCTTSEETGMEGAKGLDLSPCKGKRLLNLDTEIEGELICGCAGGGRMHVELPINRMEGTGCYYEIRVHGLLGGHSGVEINTGRANSNKLMARVLRQVLQNHPIGLVSFEGGKKDNAIPRETTAVISVLPESVEGIATQIADVCEKIRSEYNAADPDIQISFTKAEPEPAEDGYVEALSLETTRHIVMLLLSLPNGVIRMSDHISGLVETSLNLGILFMGRYSLAITYSLRSSVEAAYEALRENMRFMAEGFGAKVSIAAEYPGWEFASHSPLRDRVTRIYKEITGKKATVAAIHAGLECGIFCKKIKGLDAVAIGPDIFDIHTPNERLSISSTARTYECIRAILSEKQ